MSFIYPWLVTIRRPNRVETVGDVGYNALRGDQDESTVGDWPMVAEGLKASIQIDRDGRRNLVGLPSDADSQALWKVFIPIAAVRGLAADLIQTGDVVLGSIYRGQEVACPIRYQVFAPYINSLGWQIRAKVLEV
jgi:hypothetical protein